MTTSPAGVRTLRRSVSLFKAFRREQSDPDMFYGLIAEDAVSLLATRVSLRHCLAVDIGAGAGYFTKALRAGGARCVVVEPDLEELSWRGAKPEGSVVGDGLRLPLRTAVADLVVSSNVLEHVAEPYRMLGEMGRVLRPGGLLWASFTNWLSPWGGHETSPWHYLGGERAARRYERQHGRPPKNRYGTSLFPLHIGDVLRHVDESTDFDVVEVVPRYLPAFARGVLRVPGLREVATWNLEMTLRRVEG